MAEVLTKSWCTDKVLTNVISTDKVLTNGWSADNCQKCSQVAGVLTKCWSADKCQHAENFLFLKISYPNSHIVFWLSFKQADQIWCKSDYYII